MRILPALWILILAPAQSQPEHAFDTGAQMSRFGKAQISRFDQESPALEAGLRIGDVITAVDGVPVTYNALIEGRPPWTKRPLKIEVERDGVPHSFEVRPVARDGQYVIGVRLKRAVPVFTIVGSTSEPKQRATTAHDSTTSDASGDKRRPAEERLQEMQRILAELRQRSAAVGVTSRCEDGLWISSVSSDGQIIVLDDDSVWEVDLVDRLDSQYWSILDDVIACDDKLINEDEKEIVAAERIK